MKKNNFLRGGEFDLPYTSPQVELLEVTIEQGFNLSGGYMSDNGFLSDDWDREDI